MNSHDNVSHEADAKARAFVKRRRRARRSARVFRAYIVALVALAILTSVVATVNITFSRRAATPAQATSVDQRHEQPQVASKPAETPQAEAAATVTRSEEESARPPRESDVSVMAKDPQPAPAVAATPAPPPALENHQRTQPITEPRPIAPTARVAQWMADTYGKAEAERRIADAMAIYPAGDDRLVHWRKVLGHLRAMADR